MKFMFCNDAGSIVACEPADRRSLVERCREPAAELIIPGKSVKLQVFSLTELESATGGFGKASLLGKATHGCIYKGSLKDGRSVAVKRQEYVQDEIAFTNELEILSTLHSHRFVNVLGFSRGSAAQEKLLVVEFAANGNLHNALHHTSEPVGWALRIQTALQTAKAILALHSANPAVIHRDVKSENVMLDGKWNAKLGGFGLACRGHIDDMTGRLMLPSGTLGSTDPEYETPSRLSTKLDVFSFGILLLEILSGRKAIDVRYKPPSIVDWALPLIKQGKAHCIYDCRLRFPSQYTKALRLMAAIAARCVRRSSSRRPSMAYVVAGLREVRTRVPLPKWTGLARVVKRTASWQIRPGRDVSRSPDFLDMMSSARAPTVTLNLGSRQSLGKLMGIFPEQGATEQSRQQWIETSRRKALASSIGRLRMRLTEQMRRPSPQKKSMESRDNDDDLTKELPRDTLDLSFSGRTETYKQWRNPVFDAARSPRRVFYPTDLSVLPNHRPGLSGAAIPLIPIEDGGGACPEEAACFPKEALKISSRIRSRSITTSTRKSHIKTRVNFEREEALLPW